MDKRNSWGYNIENKDIDIHFRTFKGSVYKCDNIVFKILTQNDSISIFFGVKIWWHSGNVSDLFYFGQL